jgi:hypothetical protein
LPTIRKRAGAGGEGGTPAYTLRPPPPSRVDCHYGQTMPRDRGHRSVRDCGLAQHRRRMARKTAKSTLHAADGIWGGPPYFEGSVSDTDPGAVPTGNLGIRRQYHKGVHLGAGHPARIWCICGPWAPNTASCRGRGIAMQTRSEPRPSSLVAAKDQVILAHCEGYIGEPPQGGKWPAGTESGDPSSRRTLHSHDPGPRPPGGTREGSECYPS